MSKIPDILYLETTELRSLGFRISHHSSFTSLKEICDKLHIKIAVVDLCIDEAIEAWCVNIENGLKSIRSLEPYTGEKIQFSEWVHDGDKRRDKLKKEYLLSLAANNVSIISNVSVDQEALVKKAVRKIPPFREKGEKGFRDSIITQTIIEHYRDEYESEWPGGIYVVISADSDISNALGSCGGNNELLFPSSKAAIENIEKFSDKEFQQYIVDKTKELSKYLEQYSGEIESYLNKSTIYPKGFLVGSDVLGVIKSIQSLKLNRLEASLPGRLPEGEKEGEIEIDVGAYVTINLAVESYTSDESYLQVGQPAMNFPKTQDFQAVLSQLGMNTTTKPIERYVPISATVHLSEKDDGSMVYSDFKIRAAEPSQFSNMLMMTLRKSMEEENKKL